MNEPNPEPIPTSQSQSFASLFSPLSPNGSQIKLERPPKREQSNTNINNLSAFLSSSSVTNNALSTEPDGNTKNNGDRLLTFYQGLVPPHVRVFKRHHPDRRPNETDEEYGVRWQLFEYAKLHPLTPPTFFYDIEIKDELLVPMKESSSLLSTCFTVIEDGSDNENDHRHQLLNTKENEETTNIDPADEEAEVDIDLQEETYVWENESVPNILPLQCPKEMRKFSENCIHIRSVASVCNLSFLGTKISAEMLKLPPPPSESETKFIISPVANLSFKKSKSVTFSPIPLIKIYQRDEQEHGRLQIVSSSSTNLIKPKRRSRSLPIPSSRRSSRNVARVKPITIPRSSYIALMRHLTRQSSFSQTGVGSGTAVRFKSFEEMFNRPESKPSRSLYSSTLERKLLSHRYTFYNMSKEKSRSRTRKRRKDLQHELRWNADRLHQGKPTMHDLVNTNTSFFQKIIPRFFKFSDFTKLFRN